jgi:flagellin FlaB
VEQATSNLELVGNIYGLATTPASGINSIVFSISLTPGAPDADLTKMTVMYSSDTVSPITYTYGGATADVSHFSAVLSGTTTPAASISQTEQVTITIDLDAAKLTENKRYNVEIRPIKGSVYAFSRMTGAKIFTTNVL